MTGTDQAPDLPGYTPQRLLGSGGFADVFLYEEHHPRRPVAVKVLRQAVLDESVRRRFRDEADTMASLAEHPNIVSVLTAGTTASGQLYLVMRYYQGKNLGEQVRSEGPLDVPAVLKIGIQIAGAVETAHRANVIHRDIKPANILMSSFGPALTDFGVAGRTADIADDDDVALSIPWAPPEVVSGDSNGSRQGDVYSLGATLWELLVGRSPLEFPEGGDNSRRALTARVLQAAPPRTGRSDVPDSLERLLQQALAKRPQQRPRTALEFARALQAVEREQRFAVTEALVFDDGTNQAAAPEPLPTGPTPAVEATRLRGAGRADPQRGQATPTLAQRTPAGEQAAPTMLRGQRATAQSDPPPPRTRASFPSGGELPGTVLRPARPSTTEPVPAPEPRRPPKRRTLLLAGSGAVVAAVVVGVIVATAGGSPGSHSTASDLPPVDQQQSAVDLDPGLPVVTGGRTSPSTVHFTWTYDNAQAGDTFVWKTADQVEHPVATASADVPGTGQVCAQVQVRRPGGSVQTYSAPVCAG